MSKESNTLLYKGASLLFLSMSFTFDSEAITWMWTDNIPVAIFLIIAGCCCFIYYILMKATKPNQKG